MTLIISDASPLHYLALIGQAHILPALYGRVIVPLRVFDELQRPNTPETVKAFVQSRPAWLEIQSISTRIDESLLHLDRGEQEAITLAIEIKADTLLIDETKGRRAAKERGLITVGTLAALLEAARADLCNLEDSFILLKQTNFRATEKLYQYFLDLYGKEKM
ncbi:MAG: DUF3368 domain-containing protein [Blastocatellia bacterium]